MSVCQYYWCDSGWRYQIMKSRINQVVNTACQSYAYCYPVRWIHTWCLLKCKIWTSKDAQCPSFTLLLLLLCQRLWSSFISDNLYQCHAVCHVLSLFLLCVHSCRLSTLLYLHAINAQQAIRLLYQVNLIIQWWRHLVAKFVTHASDAMWWLTMQHTGCLFNWYPP